MCLSTPHSIQMFGDKTTAVARTTKAFFRTLKVTSLHENLFQSVVLHQLLLQLQDTLELKRRPSHLSCLDGGLGGRRRLFTELSKHRNL